ncbi:MAG: large subunit ribosomal protein [Candidatus Sumerlaeota bacterium]|nr:large subunit ribosomal protein [Candidatus Sumerlaeota bacterium]
MPKHGKKYKQVAALVDREKRYNVEEAVGLLRKLSYAKFDESVQLNIRLGVDPRNADQQVRGTVALPNGTGKKVRVAVFAQGDKLREAEEAGADVAGGEDLVKKVTEGFLDFDACVATPDMMRFVGRLGKVLGPRGMMPNPKVGTVTMDVAGAIEALKGGQVEYRLDRFAIIHVLVGKMSFKDEALVENIRAMLEAIIKAKPAAAKGVYIKSIALSSTMSPGLRLDVAEARVQNAAA